MPNNEPTSRELKGKLYPWVDEEYPVSIFDGVACHLPDWQWPPWDSRSPERRERERLRNLAEIERERRALEERY